MVPLFNGQCSRDFWPENRGDLSNEQKGLSVEGLLAAYSGGSKIPQTGKVHTPDFGPKATI